MNLLTTHHRTRGNGQGTRRAADAGRKMGEMLAATPRARGVRMAGRSVGGRIVLPPKAGTPTLAALGISKRESAEAVRTGAGAVAVGVDVAGAAGRVFLADHETPLTPPVDSRDILTGLRLAPRTHGAH